MLVCDTPKLPCYYYNAVQVLPCLSWSARIPNLQLVKRPLKTLHETWHAHLAPLLKPAPLQVAAYTSGRRSINKFDCLLLQHMLWQRPDESQRILDFLLERLAVESSTQQTDFLFDGEHDAVLPT